MKSALKLFVATCALTAITAHAEGEYNVTAARVQGTLTCALSKNSGGTFDCTLHVKGQGEVAITMNPANDKNGNLMGFGVWTA